MISRIFERLYGLRLFARAIAERLDKALQPERSLLFALPDRRRFSDGLTWCIAGPRMLVTFTLAYTCGVAFATYGCSPWWLAWAALPVGLLTVVSSRWKAGLALLLMVIFGWGYCLWRMPRPASGDLSRYAFRRGVIFTGQIETVLPVNSPSRARVVINCRQMIFPDRKNLSGKTVATISGAVPAIQAGDQLQLTASVRLPEAAHFPWDFNYARYLQRQGVFSLCTSNSDSVNKIDTASALGPAQGGYLIELSLKRWLEQLRRRVVETHRACLGLPAGDLLSSFVLGDRAVRLTGELSERFRVLGLSHLLAASGFNLTLVTGLAWWSARFIIRTVWGVNLFCFLAMLMFVGLAGPSPSVVRAALMCTFLLGSRCLFRTLYTPAALSMALLITLLIDPAAVSDVGLQLSYAATAGIVSGARLCARKSDSTRRLPVLSWLKESVAIVLIAQASVMPIQLAYFWQVGMLFLPANLAVTPLVSAVSVLGFLSTALVIFDWRSLLTNSLVSLLDRLLAYPINLIMLVVDVLSRYEAAKLDLGPPEAWAVVFYYFCLTGMFASLRIQRFRTVACVLFLLALGLIVWRPSAPALTLCSFKGAVILMTADRQAVCLGETERLGPTRCLQYFGATAAPLDSGAFAVSTRTNSVLSIDCRPAKCRVCLVDGGGPIPAPAPKDLPVSAIILTGPAGGGQPVDSQPETVKAEFDRIGKDTAVRLRYSGGPPDIDGLVRFVKESGCRWVIVNCEAARFRRLMDLLVEKLHEIPGVRALRSGRAEFMLVGGGYPIELRPSGQQVVYDNVSKERN
jgi:competence protein ComEC